MATKRFETLGYQPFRPRPLISEGLLGVAREGGDLERRVAQGLFSLANYFGDKADAEAERLGYEAGQKAAWEGRATSSIVHDDGQPALGKDGKPVKAKPAGQMAAYTRDRLMKVHGFPAHVAAAVGGHGQAESAFNPNASGDGGTAIGYYQWRGARAANLKAFAAKRGTSWKDADTQIDFVVHELKTSEGLAWSALQRSSNVEQATAAFMNFERPQGWSIANPRGGHNFSGRLAYAQGLLGADAPPPAVPDAILDPVTTAAVPALPDAAPVMAGVTLNAGTARPSGRDTVYGRAYDKALVKTYLTSLDAEISSTTSQIFRTHREDPARMAEAFDSLRREFLKGSVFPQIGVDFEQAYLARVNGYLETAFDEQATRVKQADQAEFMDRTQKLESGVQQAISGMDPKNPHVADEIAAQQATIDAHYDEAVQRGLMTAPAAESAKISSRRNAALDFYNKQADGLDAPAIDAMRKAMEADYADGGIDGLDGEGWRALDAGLKQAEKSRRIEARQAENALREDGDLFAQKILGGFEVNKDEWARFAQAAAAAPAGTPDVVAETEAKIAAARAIRDLTPAAAQKYLEDQRKAAGAAPDDKALRLIGFTEAALADKQKALRTDPLSYAESQHLVAPSGNLSEAAANGPDAVSAMMAKRAKDAETVEAHFGGQARLLKAGEGKALADMAKKDPAAATALAGALVEGAGPRIRPLLKEIGTHSPAVEAAGAILAGGGSPQAAEDALAGAGRTPEGKAWPSKGVQSRSEAAQAISGVALTFQPEDARRIEWTAERIARKRIGEAGVDEASAEAAAIHAQALQEAAGATFENGAQYGGFSGYDPGWRWPAMQTAIPPDMRADRFQDVIDGLTDADLGANAPDGGKAALEGLWPVLAGKGYVFMDLRSDGAVPLAGPDGKPFMLDLNGLAPRLKARFPGAWRS